MGATFSRLKNWAAEILTNEDLNAEIDNILTNFTPAGMDDYSANATQMKLQTSPGAVGTESLATSMAGEIERLRYVVARITGETYWYTTPDSTINDIAAALGNALYRNRIESGRVVSGSSQPIYLVPHGTNATATLKATTTNFVYYVDGVRYTLTSDVVSGTLSTAPATNNTGTVSAATAFAGEAYTKTVGEVDSTMLITSPGSEWTSRVGQMAAFNVGTEYFLAQIGASATTLSNAFRGFYYDSADAGIARSVLSAGNTVNIMKLAWMFVNTSGALVSTYNPPYVTGTTPTGTSVGDYWLDLTTGIWKYTVDGTNFIQANATFIGMVVLNTTGAKAARSFDFFRSFADVNTVETYVSAATTISTRRIGPEISVYGTNVRYQIASPIWNITTDLDSGIVEAGSTTYYLYLKENGDEVISDIQPHDRRNDLKGFYHPYKAWRCVGEAYNNSSSDLDSVVNYSIIGDPNQQRAAPVFQGRLTGSTGLAVPLNNLTAVTTIYYTPYIGNKVSLFEGGQWNTYSFRELSVTLPASTDTNYDVCLSSVGGVLKLGLVQWVNANARLTATSLIDGINVLSTATNVLVLGSVRTTGASGETEDSRTKRYIYNAFNRVDRNVKVTDTTDSWVYSTATIRQARATAGNKVEVLFGFDGNRVDLMVLGIASSSTATFRNVSVGIGASSTTVYANDLTSLVNVNSAGAATMYGYYRTLSGLLGYNYFAWLEKGGGTDTTSWYGDAGFTDLGQSGLIGYVCV